MEELDCVKLIKPFDDLKVGTKGCIVLKYTENDFEGIHQRFPHWHIEQNKRRFLGVFL